VFKLVKRVVIYGWAVPVDKVRGAGSGALIDLVYFVDDEVSIGDVLNIINHAGYKMIPKRIGNQRTAPVEQDKVQIEDWEQHITKNVTVGSEQLPENYQINYDRYNYPGEY
jgi:hypothetical protein